MTASLPASLCEYPWLQATWARTVGDLDALHHGLLITGVSGTAKREFAMALGQRLLCADAGDPQQPCGRCQNCTLFRAGTHPDFHVLTTELERRDGRVALATKYCDRYQDIGAREKRANPGRVIPVDQVRLLIERFCVHAHIATRKVALIMPADRMNMNAANALLKLLEEPPANSILILLSALPGYLPATLRSRCFTVGVPLPTAEIATAWLGKRMSADEATRALSLSNGGPLDALKLFEDGFLSLQEQFVQGIAELAGGQTGALELAARFKQHDFLQWLDWLHRFSCELIRWGCGLDAPHWHAQIRLDARRLAVEKMFALYDKIGRYRKIAREQINEQLAMEELTLTLQNVLRG